MIFFRQLCLTESEERLLKRNVWQGTVGQSPAFQYEFSKFDKN